jgi:hypothetical protein
MKFRFIWPSGFREEDFLEIDQSATGIACAGLEKRHLAGIFYGYRPLTAWF